MELWNGSDRLTVGSAVSLISHFFHRAAGLLFYDFMNTVYDRSRFYYRVFPQSGASLFQDRLFFDFPEQLAVSKMLRARLRGLACLSAFP